MLRLPDESKCVRGNKPRAVTIGYYEKKRMAAKERQGTAEFKEGYRQRACVERVIAWLTGHGARHARYIGRKKTRFQLQVIAAVCNTVALYRELAARAKLAKAIAG
ncbi:MAG: transposase [Bacillota bacterium]|nr:transposase [Bacillota bacterium]